MLVLTRKPGERIVIGDDIVVTLISIRRDDTYGDRIRIGLEAPNDVVIRREEVADQRKLNQEAAEPDFSAVGGESRELRQKLQALESQIAREGRKASPDARVAETLSAELISLRRRCEELLDELGKTAAADPP